MKSIEIFCDGSALGNPGYGGYCSILRYKGVEKIIKGGELYTTNNRMELKAVIEALKVLKEPCNIHLYSDSVYVCKGISEWLKMWVAKNFAKVKNVDLWQEFLRLKGAHAITTHWIKGHDGHAENERCDKLAKEQALSYKQKAREC
ncbi:ribonuclease HI [Helicobacter ailurogastricus]|uniref:Ribonuclease HI n=1 Tax=Helicobacter ailurogastricus TaxID=1578720 RepID=A0A0K2XXR9_9HELI|nr:ribonuclease HI [Helicobacter ailurogastricus]CRF41309.1 Ribonuclease HI [Helicobacter ailurogastricus]CRF42581.1 Ribonuclease HI [Helicobacter ailurogastricus]CRF44601.1 Ribonuclease HI [Helicobacter ailurogastricus]CRF51936.1 Ribonuclease HI [Helicobacter ailurogastricus]BDQ29044.1 ribonuclease HI [Helicobacter ailurogastricus]